MSGGYDYDCKMWDFAGMNASHKPFRSFEMTEGHQVRRLPVACSGGLTRHRFMTLLSRLLGTASLLRQDQTRPSCSVGTARSCSSSSRGTCTSVISRTQRASLLLFSGAQD